MKAESAAIPLDHLVGEKLSQRDARILAKAGITTLGQLASTSIEDLIQVENLGMTRTIPLLIELVAIHLGWCDSSMSFEHVAAIGKVP